MVQLNDEGDTNILNGVNPHEQKLRRPERKRFPSLILDGYEFLLDNVVTSEGELVYLAFLDNVERVGWEQAIKNVVAE